MQKLDEYQAFVAIVDGGSLAAAARTLHLSPSAVSKKLGVLEAGLGVQLIDRSTRSLAVTDIGRTFYDDCKALLNAAADAEERLLDRAGEPSGKLRLSCPRVLLQRPFLAMISDFRRTWPGIRVGITVSDTLDDLVEGDIDFAFRVGPLRDSRLQALPLAEVATVFCASPDYLAANGRPQRLADLKAHNVILPTYLNLSDKLRQLFANQHAVFDLQQFDSADDPRAIHLLAREGAGIAMQLELVVGEDIENGRLERLLPELALPTQPVSLLWSARRSGSRKLSLFKEFVKEHFPG